jgi:uncharacterized protein YyaL (SSP411 family)
MSDGKKTKGARPTNRLINENSPYLLSHAHNPVDWYPWSKEALEKARREDKPIFLSIGYAACHWCHVMEKESFENEEIAAILNRHYISIKVDREQRPDIDHIYMQATMAMTGGGGWPLSVFLTPDLKPFFAGTYFPPENGYGRPGFKYIISEIAKGFINERANIDKTAKRIAAALEIGGHPATERAELDQSILDSTYRAIMKGYDPINGGFGSAPKFPHPVELSFLLLWHKLAGDEKALEAVEKSLRAMGNGGIFDQIGGGFHRYSTDSRWLVPHFEKMLYDNALLAVVYAEAYQITGDEFYRKIARRTLDFILREMRDGSGGFYSSLDADSGGQEGKYYVWTKREIESILGGKAELFCKYYNIGEYGNFEGDASVPNVDGSSQKRFELTGLSRDDFDKSIEESAALLYKARRKRIRPSTDDKILTSWNGLAISGLCKGYQITLDARYKEAAIKAAQFIRGNLYRENELGHALRDGRRLAGTFLEDYAYLTTGLIELYEIDPDFEWIKWATKLAHEAIAAFSDRAGNLYLAAENPEEYYIRPMDIADGALPAPGSAFIQSILRLYYITGEEELKKRAEEYLAAISNGMISLPQAMASAAAALSRLISERTEIVLVGGKNSDQFAKEIYRFYVANKTIIFSERGDEDIPPLKEKKTDGLTMAYICRNNSCWEPITDIEKFKEVMRRLGK